MLRAIEPGEIQALFISDILPSMTIEAIINQLKGQKCWRPWRGAAYTIYLELGEKHPNRKGEKELRKGSYTIGLTNCPWYVLQNNQLMFGTDSTYEQIDEHLTVFACKTVENIQIDRGDYEGIVTFSEGLVIKIKYSDPRDEWDIITLENEVVVTKDKIAITPAEVR